MRQPKQEKSVKECVEAATNIFNETGNDLLESLEKKSGSRNVNTPVKRSNTLDFQDIIYTLINTREVIDDDTLKAIGELISFQRAHEDTKARQRLEKWTKWIISLYLLFVCVIVVCNAIQFNFIPTGFISDVILKHISPFFGYHLDLKFEISDMLMTTILSSTTVTVLGLVIIVLKGHFPNNHKEDK